MSYSLPIFMEKTAAGLVVDCVQLRRLINKQSDGFIQAINDIFGHEMRFYGLDYAVFSELVLNPDLLCRTNTHCRLAADVVSFPEYRQVLYKGVRFLDDNMQVEYIFQPVLVETPYQQPLYGDKQVDGSIPITGYEKRIRQEDAVLDMDEFIASMWQKGIRCGLLLDQITPALFSKKITRMVIAQGKAAQSGKSAEIMDMLTSARQIAGPVWRQGQWDLRCFANKFPAISQGQTILKKTPISAGHSGYTVTAEILPPAAPQDIDMSVLVGEGVLLQDRGDAELLVANMDGFLGVDGATKKLFVTRTIETQVDINVKNTGDMALASDQYISHGEVQEARLVTGKHMRFTAPVYGNVLSEEGSIALEDVLSGGSAVVTGAGSIRISQRALNARMVACQGSMDVHYAENCLIIGDVVTLGHAVHCTVVANQLRIGSAQACAIAAKSLHIDHCADHKSEPTRVLVATPDLKPERQQMNAGSLALKQTQLIIAAKVAELGAIKKNTDFAKYLALRDAMQADPHNISVTQKEEFAVLQRSQAVHLKTIERLLKELQKARANLPEQSANVEMLKDAFERKLQQYFCQIAQITGDTNVYTLQDELKLSALSKKTLKEVAQWLRTAMSAEQATVLFQGHSGAVDWRLPPD